MQDIYISASQLHKKSRPLQQYKDKNVEQQKLRQLSNSSLLRGMIALCTGWHKLLNNNLLCGKQIRLYTLFRPWPKAS